MQTINLTYDGHGLNNANDPYRARVLSFAASVPEEDRARIGKHFETPEEEEQTRRGSALAQMLGLKLKKNGRYNTDFGDKTPLGLYKTAARVMAGEL